MIYSPLANCLIPVSGFPRIPRARRTAGPGAPAWASGGGRTGRARRAKRPSDPELDRVRDSGDESGQRGAGDVRFCGRKYKVSRLIEICAHLNDIIKLRMTSLINQTHTRNSALGHTTRFQIPYRFQPSSHGSPPRSSLFARLVTPLTPWPPARRSAACRPGSRRRPAEAPGTSAPPSSSP